MLVTMRKAMKKKTKKKDRTALKQDDMVMPWGEHKDKMIWQIPSNYLWYALENWDEDNKFKKKLMKRMNDEWQYREQYNTHF
jgi:uncharacterized protein (DUF3820 family)